MTRPDLPAERPWSGDALEAARLGRDLALSGIAPSLLEQVGEVVRLAGVHAVAALGGSVLRDPWAGRVLAAALDRAAAADTGLAHDQDVVRWLKAAAMVMATLTAGESGGGGGSGGSGGSSGSNGSNGVGDRAHAGRDRAPGAGGRYGEPGGATGRGSGSTPGRGSRHG